MILVLYSIFLILLTLYSYALIDLNLTLINTSWWMSLREPFIQLGYFHRDYSWYTYLSIISILFVLNYYFVKNYKRFSALKIAIITGFILLFSYPFLSHDFFNYIFDAKILTYYGQNPYLHKPMDFLQDEWLRFMHWTHRSYPYGPVFLFFTLIPSFLAFGKFILNYLLFKALFVTFYLVAVIYLSKQNKKSAIDFATHPVILIEGLVASHNDLIATSLAIVGLYYLLQGAAIKSRFVLLASALIKYITLPLVFVSKNKDSLINKAVLVFQILLIIYLSITREVQQWYILALFSFLPIYPNIIRKSSILLFGLLLSYYPYIFLGGWDSDEKLFWKRGIIVGAAILNCIYLAVEYRKKITVGRSNS